MEDATITQQAAAIQPTGMPMLVTDDDMKHEIGEWVVSGLNKDKIISSLAAQMQSLNATIAKQQEAVATSVETAKSNELFKNKNAALGNTLTEERSDAAKKLAAVQSELALKEAELTDAIKKAGQAIGATEKVNKGLSAANDKVAVLLNELNEAKDNLLESKAEIKTLKAAKKTSKPKRTMKSKE